MQKLLLTKKALMIDAVVAQAVRRALEESKGKPIKVEVLK